MSGHHVYKAISGILALAACLLSLSAFAGGITLGGTRIIYGAEQKQVGMSVRNTSDNSSFLVQSWVEQANGQKSQDFIVTPPLYVSGPGNENTLRLIYTGGPIRHDQETLYYFNTKAIPSVDKKNLATSNILLLAAITRIKLFVRPDGLTPAAEKAPTLLTFRKTADKMIEINNPTPYYITLARIKTGKNTLPDTMIAPRSKITLPLQFNAADNVTYRSINDYGSVTPEYTAKLN